MPSSKRIGYGAPGVSLREGHEDDGGRARDFVEPCPLGDRTTGSSRSKVIERAPIGLDGHLCGLEALPPVREDDAIPAAKRDVVQLTARSCYCRTPRITVTPTLMARDGDKCRTQTNLPGTFCRLWAEHASLAISGDQKRTIPTPSVQMEGRLTWPTS